MRLVVCRVNSAKLKVDGNDIANISKGLFCLLGVATGDSELQADAIAKKCSSMRIFTDDGGKMNLSVKDIGGSILVEPNFTLCANISHGNRPDFFNAMPPERAKQLFEYFIKKLRETGVEVQTGIFGADMKTDVAMDGPVTIVIDSSDLKI